MEFIFPDETMEDLALKGLRLIKPSKGFRYGTDQVLLADFAQARPHSLVCDLGAGSGILTLLLVGRAEGLRVEALEYDAVQVDRMRRCIQLNGLGDSVSVAQGDIREIKQHRAAGRFQMVICNPPYHAKEDAQDMPEVERAARTEWGCDYADVCCAAKWLLRNKGRLVTMCPARRMAEMFAALSKNGLEVKRLRLVQASAEKPPYLCLIEAMKGAKPGLRIEPVLVLSRHGEMTAEVKNIYHIKEQP